MDRQQQLIEMLSDRIAKSKAQIEIPQYKTRVKRVSIALTACFALLCVSAFISYHIATENNLLKSEITSFEIGQKNLATFKVRRASDTGMQNCNGLIQSVGDAHFCVAMPI